MSRSLSSGTPQRHLLTSSAQTIQTEVEIDLKTSCDALAQMNPAIKRFIAENGYPAATVPRRLSVFSITRIICAQQIGTAQAKTISKRVYDLVTHDIVPSREKTPKKKKRKLDENELRVKEEKEEDYGGMSMKVEEIQEEDDFTIASKILKVDKEVLKSCGLSESKRDSILGVARAIEAGDLVLNDLHSMNNNDIEKELVKLKGIGPWSAHMILLFSLGRQDVWPSGDEAVRSGLRVIFGLKKRDKNIKQDIALAEEMGKDFIGHRSALAKLCYFAHSLQSNT